MSEINNQAFVQFSKYGPPDVLEVKESQKVPEPKYGEVRIKVLSSSVCYTDTLLRKGTYPQKPKLPVVTGYDYCGTVDKLGDGVDSLVEGSLVCNLSVWGGNARYAIARADSLVVIPKTTDPDLATSLVLSWVTAYQALHRPTKILHDGSKVLITGASGAVGQALVQLAKLDGAEVYAPCKEQDQALLKQLGVDHCLPREGKDWLPLVVGKMDIAVDCIADNYFRTAHKALNRNGKLVGVGMVKYMSAGHQLRVVGSYLMVAYWLSRSSFYNITDYRDAHPKHFKEDLLALCDMLNTGKIKINVDRQVKFDQVSEIHQMLENGGVLRGKVILKPWM